MSEICSCCTCTVADCTCAGGRDPDRRIDCDGEHNCAQSGCSRYDRPKPDLLPKAETLPTFDYSGLSDQTVATLHSAEEMIRSARRYCVLKIADAVALARDELVSRRDAERKIDKNDRTFCAWCTSVGISRSDAYRLLQVSDLIEQSTPNEQKILAALPPTLLYAAAKPSAPPELVARVKKGEIVTNKDYQAAMKQKDDKIERLERTNRDQKKLLEAGEKNQEMFRRRSEQYAEACADRDRWKARAEELEARPVEVAVEIDEAEVERRAQEKAQALAAEMVRSAPVPDDPEQAEHDAYDAGLQFWRTIDNAWRLARPRASTLRPELKRAIYERCAEIFEKVRKDMTS